MFPYPHGIRASHSHFRKRLADTETKLRGALQDKTAALQEKGNLERQLKQFQSQKLIAEKNLEKKDAKRESIMVVSLTLWVSRWTALRY